VGNLNNKAGVFGWVELFWGLATHTRLLPFTVEAEAYLVSIYQLARMQEDRNAEDLGVKAQGHLVKSLRTDNATLCKLLKTFLKWPANQKLRGGQQKAQQSQATKTLN
jgi:hypothetical protein